MVRKWAGAVAALSVAAATCSLLPSASALGRTTSRLAGASRFETAAAVSRWATPQGAPLAFVVSGSSTADAIAATAVAGHFRGPVLLTERSALSSAAGGELARLHAKRLIVMGGPAAVADATFAQARAASRSTEVYRVAGADRYDSAAMLSKGSYPSGVTEAFLTTGEGPDAIALAAAAGYRGGSLLLTARSSLPDATRSELKRLHPKSVYVLGERATVADGVLDQVRAATGAKVERVGGGDSATAATRVSRMFWGTSTKVFVASASGFADALGGGAAAAGANAPVLLLPSGGVPTVVAQELQRLGPKEIVVLGGSAAVSDAQLTELAKGTPADIARDEFLQRYQALPAATTTGLTYEFDSNVSQDKQTQIKVLAETTARYLGYTGPILVGVGGDDLVRRLMRRVEPSVPAAIIGGLATTHDTVVLSSARLSDWEWWQWIGRGVADAVFKAWSGTGDGLQEAVPCWLEDGPAAYYGLSVLSVRLPSVLATLGGWDQLRRNETSFAYLHRPLPNYESCKGTAVPYTLGPAIGELLLARYGDTAVRSYWPLVRSMPWKDAFQQVFGESVDSFYDAAAAYRGTLPGRAG